MPRKDGYVERVPDVMDIASSTDRRIVIIGTSCTGKSTIASQLGHALALPCIELDELFWGPEWTPKPEETFRGLVESATADDSWIVTGNYGAVRQIFWPRATTIIWLDYCFSTVLWRALKRTVLRALTRKRLWHGNRESIRRAFFSKESILVWVCTTFHYRRSEFSALHASGAFPGARWVVLRSTRDATTLLKAANGG